MKARLWVRLFRSFTKNCATKNPDGNDTLTVGIVNVNEFCDQVETELSEQASRIAALEAAIEKHREQGELRNDSTRDAQLYTALNTEE